MANFLSDPIPWIKMWCYRLLYYITALLRNLWSLKALSALMTPLGLGVTADHASNAFFAGTPIPDHLHHILNTHWHWALFAGIVFTAWSCWPKLRFSEKLDHRDVTIEIVIADIFSLPGAIVVGTNTTFDTRIATNCISRKSIQGTFTHKYYSDEAQLDIALDAGLSEKQFTSLPGKRVGKAHRYPTGTVVKLSPAGRTAYFAAIADMNEHGNASCTFDSLKDSLGVLWEFIGQRGQKVEPVLIPVLGSGHGRLKQTREEIVREIIKSFVAACSAQNFCDKLTIVLHDNDVREHNIPVEALAEYLRHVCKYTEFAPANGENVGSPVS